jgi:hypothetical protein
MSLAGLRSRQIVVKCDVLETASPSKRASMVGEIEHDAQPARLLVQHR